MNIVVCVKQVPDTAVERTLTPEGTLDRASLDGLINELDGQAGVIVKDEGDGGVEAGDFLAERKFI